jgi:nucleoside-diphosphate-sugar epimerase
MKLFVTGATGFIGGHFLNAAMAANHHVVALRRTGSSTRIKLQREPEWVIGDLDSDLQTALTECDVFVHLASHSANPPYDTYAKCLYWNTYASLRLAEQAHECGITKFLVAGSCFEYGLSAERYKRIPATAPLEPASPYPVSKAAASLAFQSFAQQHQLQLKILRLFQVYGDGERETRFWPSLRRAAFAGEDFPMTLGAQVRDFIEVGAVADAIVAALDLGNVNAGSPCISNLGSGQAQTLRDFAEYWWKHWNAVGKLLVGEIPYRENEIMRLVPDLDVIRPDE